MVARAIVKAVAEAEMPAGVFSLLYGAGHEVGIGLVKHPLTRAVGFTGSLRGGRALFDAAASRPDPIPVYAEMGSVNPVFILPGALRDRAEAIAEGLKNSVRSAWASSAPAPVWPSGCSMKTSRGSPINSGV